MRLIVKHLGLQPYVSVWQQMRDFTETRTDSTEDELWWVQHPPVFTLGKNSKPEHVLDAGDIPIIESDRGGQVTYHGPGQLIAYVLLDTKRLHLGVRELVTRLENAVIDTLAHYNIESRARRDAPGVYVEGKKIAALGLRLRKHCCYHGLALNVDMDLAPFSRIDPCGYPGLEVTQLKDWVANITFEQAAQDLLAALMRQLQYNSYSEVTDNKISHTLAALESGSK